jgi:hypothetical protein
MGIRNTLRKFCIMKSVRDKAKRDKAKEPEEK